MKCIVVVQMAKTYQMNTLKLIALNNNNLWKYFVWYKNLCIKSFLVVCINFILNYNLFFC